MLKCKNDSSPQGKCWPNTPRDSRSSPIEIRPSFVLCVPPPPPSVGRGRDSGDSGRPATARATVIRQGRNRRTKTNRPADRLSDRASKGLTKARAVQGSRAWGKN